MFSRSWLWMLLLVAVRPLLAADGDKGGLFNTFYLDGDSITYVLVMHGGDKKTFELYGAGKEKISGSVRASETQFSLLAGDVQRHFNYDLKGSDLKIGPRDDDVPVKGNLLGEMPPVKSAFFRTIYLSEDSWKKKRRPVFEVPKGETPPAPQPPKEVALPSPVGDFQDIAGTYRAASTEGAAQTLRIEPGGKFTLTCGEASQDGVLLRSENDLTFVVRGVQRQMALKLVAGALQLRRRETDVVVEESGALGTMLPILKDPVTWTRAQNN